MISKYHTGMPVEWKHVSSKVLKFPFRGNFGKRNGDFEIAKLREDIIGNGFGFLGPYGWKKYTYVDHTASGKALRSIESFIETEVLPHYANTHTTISNTSYQTTIFRKEARDIIKQSVGASEEDEVIFCGSGSTSAVHKLLHHVAHPKQRKLVVFIGPFEHHSNILPWREVASKVIQVPMSELTGHLDTEYLEKSLKRVTQSGDKGQLIVGSFSAGSNVTGVLTDDVKITELLHEYGALSFWDYAAAAPHVPINMNPGGTNCQAQKDAIFFSGHKFLGGPQTPGVLIVKRHVLQNPVPHGVGGGTVLYTTGTSQKYLTEVHDREEGGTPDIIGSIRLGLVFQTRNCIGTEYIIEREAMFCRKVLKSWNKVPEIHILGCSSGPRLPIISFMIQHLETGYYLHHNFVVALLNDLFGIQCRGGCMCAGPYGEILLGIDGNSIVKLFSSDKKWNGKESLANYSAILKPGFVRVSLNFHSSEEEVDFLIEAVRMIAKHGWKLLPFYTACIESGNFIFNDKLLDRFAHEQLQTSKNISLTSFDPFSHSLPQRPKSKARIDSIVEFDYNHCLKDVKSFMDAIKESIALTKPSVSGYPKSLLAATSSYRRKKFRWFMSQKESAMLQRYNSSLHLRATSMPFKPLKVNFTKTLTWKDGSIPNIVSLFWNSPITTDSSSFNEDECLMECRRRSARYLCDKVWSRWYSDVWEWKTM